MKSIYTLVCIICFSLSLQAQVKIKPDSSTFTGKVTINNIFENNNLIYPTSDGKSGQLISTDGNGNLIFKDDATETDYSQFFSYACDTIYTYKVDLNSSSDEDCGRIFDSGGEFGNYGNNENESFSIFTCTDDPIFTRVILHSLDIEENVDTLFIEDQFYTTNVSTSDTLIFEGSISVDIVFKSNSQNLGGPYQGFDISFERLFPKNESSLTKSPFGFFFNSEKQALGGGVEQDSAWSKAGMRSVLLGYNDRASGERSTSVGYNNTVISFGGSAYGNNNVVNGSRGTAVGSFNETNNSRSTAIGDSNDATGSGSTAIGNRNRATTTNSSAFGYDNIVDVYQMTAIGSYNEDPSGSSTSWVATDPVFMIGNGQNPGNRSTAMTVLKNGNVGIGNTNPSCKLEIESNSVMNIPLRALQNASTGDAISAESHAFGGRSGVFSGRFIGVVADVPSFLSNDGNSYGAFCRNLSSGDGEKFGVFGQATSSTPGNNYGVYGDAFATLGSWAGYFDGDFYYTGSFTSTSDARLKKDIKNIRNPLHKVLQLRPKTYQFKTKEYDYINLAQGDQIGFLAQDVEKVLPELVETANHVFHEMDAKTGEIDHQKNHRLEIKSMNYIGFIPVLTGAIQEQQQQIEEKDREIIQLKNQMTEILERLTLLEEVQKNCCQDRGSLEERTTNELKPRLLQNQPNPFNQSTIIEYFIPDTAEIASISVFSVDGTLIKTFDIAAAGYGKIEIESLDLTGGSYFYALIVDSKIVDSKTMKLTN